MAEKTGKEATEWVTPLGFEAVMDMQRPAFTAMAEVNSRLFERIAEVNKEWASFVNRRLKEDLAVPEQLAQCTTIQELYQVYARFFQNACAHYQSGLEQLTKLGTSLAQTALPSQPSHSDAQGRTKH
jgi:hypothetical protein